MDRKFIYTQMNIEIDSWLAQLKACCPSVDSVWLIGSRANDSARENSDWDFIAFANQDALTQVQQAIELHRTDVDFLIVVNGENFKNAWGEREKHGNLTSWEWALVTDIRAEYTEAKWVETDDEAQVILRRRIAIRV
jgi:hypothetical protein